MKKNTYFEEMHRIGTEYEAARAARQIEKKKLIVAENWDAVKAWNEREENDFPFPFKRGEMDAYGAWANSNDDLIEVSRLPWERDTADFVNAMKKAGIKKILITDKSTGLMDGLFSLTEYGCSVIGLKTFTRMEDGWDGPEETEIRGIEVKII